MKKLLVVFLTLVLIIGILGCSQATPTPTATTTTSPFPTTTSTTPTTVQPIKLKVNSVVPENHASNIVLRKILGDVEARSQGRLKFDMYYGEGLAPTAQALDALKTGAYDVLMSYPGYYAGADPRFNLGAVAFAFKNLDDFIKTLRTTQLGSWLEDASKRFNSHIVTYQGQGASHLFMTNKKITKLEDFAGLKMRATGPAEVEVLKKFGAVPTTVLAAEMYVSFEKGIVVGGVLPYYVLDSLKLKEIVHYITVCNFIAGAMNMEWVNLDTWNKLPKDLRDIWTQVGTEFEAQAMAYWEKGDEVYKKMATDAKIETYNLPQDEFLRWAQIGGVAAWDWTATQLGSDMGPQFIQIVKQHLNIK